MNNKPARHPNRLPHFDYSQNGGYFLTLCAKDRQPLFGHFPNACVGGGVLDAPLLQLSGWGKIVEGQLRAMSAYYPGVWIDLYTIMPNHVHLLLRVARHNPAGLDTPDTAGASRTPPPTNSVGNARANQIVPAFVSTFKRLTNRQANASLWQRGYHDHIIRNEADYQRIWRYIEGNPARWQEDCLYIADVTNQIGRQP